MFWPALGSQGRCLAMSDHSHDSPRRYFVDGSGRRVLVGLTIEETSEFEALDGFATVGSCGTKAVSWVANGAAAGLSFMRSTSTPGVSGWPTLGPIDVEIYPL